MPKIYNLISEYENEKERLEELRVKYCQKQQEVSKLENDLIFQLKKIGDIEHNKRVYTVGLHNNQISIIDAPKNSFAVDIVIEISDLPLPESDFKEPMSTTPNGDF